LYSILAAVRASLLGRDAERRGFYREAREEREVEGCEGVLRCAYTPYLYLCRTEGAAAGGLDGEDVAWTYLGLDQVGEWFVDSGGALKAVATE
jgi:hypothetical protein